MLDFVAGKENVIFLGLSQDPQTLYRTYRFNACWWRSRVQAHDLLSLGDHATQNH
jgi:hypothetical protein